MTGRRVAITGAAGHLGRDLVERLLDLDLIEEVVALDIVALDRVHEKLRVVQADVRAPGLEAAFAGCDTLVHLAFVVETSRDLVAMEEINVLGTQNTVEAAARAGVRQVIYTSSIAAYGFHPENRGVVLTEESPIRGNPEFTYSHTKAEVERWLDTFEASHPEVAVCRLRPSAFLDSGTRRPIAAPVRGRLFLRLPGEDLEVHVTHQHDVVEALVLALTREARGAYNVCSSDPLPFSGWGAAMRKRVVKLPRFTQRALSAAYRAGLIQTEPGWFTVAASHPIVVSSDKIRRELGWRPCYPTTGVTLREVSGRQTACASRATRLLLGAAALRTRLDGNISASEHERYEVLGIQGDLNLLLTGEHPSEWHASFDGGRVGLHAGLSRSAKATVTLADRTFHELLAGHTSPSACQLTGKIRFQGEGEFNFFLGAFVQRFKALRTRQGLGGIPARAFTGLVLKRAGIQPAGSAS